MAIVRNSFDREIAALNSLLYNTLENVEGFTSQGPALEVLATTDSLVVTVELPGLDPASLEIEATAERLTVRGDRPQVALADGVRRLYSDRRGGRFERSLQLPVKVKPAAASLEFRDGLLTLTLPKLEPEHRRVVKLRLDSPDPSSDATPR